ncbi:extracellular ribonuclease LE-like protein [Cinnamomum micranthum f. kanehirae]|uniref:Extracellular ribonuclease LE-like protein n=1 Tax=Cinnamomum micranthum f. kanehirae TaxID=337451 RepID=A0A443NG29_9MAGN|nr:extracellular ribonuclease LE-like protein [Cinnamomum micranthum f. kanehirae]
MARHIALAFLLSLLFCAQNIAYADFDCAQNIAYADDCAQNNAYADLDFDFYYLVLKWPGSYCKDCTVNGCCMPTTFTNYPLEEDFLIKGLYTYSDSGQAVTKCNTTKFYVNALRNLIGDLYVHWPSIKCPSNNGVSQWRDAWTNYGVCSGLSEEDYFDKALKLRKKINLLSVLKGHGVLPSDFLFYSPLYVETAIKVGLGADVGIKCSTNESGKCQIDEIYVCVDKTASKVINCPVLPKFICGQIAYLPTFSNSMLKDTSSCFDPHQMVTCE